MRAKRTGRNDVLSLPYECSRYKPMYLFSCDLIGACSKISKIPKIQELLKPHEKMRNLIALQIFLLHTNGTKRCATTEYPRGSHSTAKVRRNWRGRI